MSQRLPISCFIIAQNEADRIGRTIASVVDVVDEIVVIDSGSTDGTQDVAQRLGARVVFNKWPGFGQQKRFGEAQCKNDWLLNLDADEVLDATLTQSIREAFANGPPRDTAAFGMPALVVYPGHTKPRPFARDHYVYRLYDRRRANFKNDTLFDSVDVRGLPTAPLNGAIDHFSVRSFDHLIAKCDERATYNAQHAKKKAKPLLALRLVTEFPMSFLKYYFWRTHFLGGLTGFRYALILSYYRFVRIARMFAPAVHAPVPDKEQPR
jgi:glycosyltransferase involved in cell wall biosynthesis